MNAFTSKDFAVGQVYDMAEVLVQVSPKVTPFLTFMQSRMVKANSPQFHWIEEALADSAVTLAEGGDAPAFVKDNLKPRDNYLEIFASLAAVTHTAKYSASTTASDLLAHEVEKKTKAIANLMEDRFINGTKSYTASTYKTDGILAQIDPANKLSGATFDATQFEATLELLYDAGVGNNMVAFIPARMKQVLNDSGAITHLSTDKTLGYDAHEYESAFGNVTFILTPSLKDKMVVVNPDFLKMPVLIPLHGEVECASGSKDAIYIETQAGIVLTNSKAAAVFEITPAP